MTAPPTDATAATHRLGGDLAKSQSPRMIWSLSDWAILFALMMFAAIPRFWSLELMEFKLDEARLDAMAREAVRGRLFQVGIPSSQGVPNPPMAVELFAIPAAVSADPLALAAFSAILGCCTVGTTYWVGRRFFTRRVGLLAALTVATSFWAVLLSRKIWAQDLLPMLSILLLAALLEWRLRGSILGAICAPVLFSVAAQTHLSMLAYAPFIALVAIRGAGPGQERGRRRAWLCWSGGLLVGSLLAAPFALYLVRVGPIAYWKQLTAHGPGLPFDQGLLRGLRYLCAMAGSDGMDYVTDRTVPEFIQNPGPFGATATLTMALMAIGAMVALGSRYRSAGRIVVVYVGCLLAAFVLGAPMPHPHYFASAIPAAALLVGLAAECPVPPGVMGRWSRRLVLATIGLLLGLNSLNLVHFLTDLGKKSWIGDYGIPYRDSQEAVNWLLADGLRRGRPVAFLPSDEEAAIVYLASRHGLPIRIGAPTKGDLVIGARARYKAPISGIPPRSWQSRSGLLVMDLYNPD